MVKIDITKIKFKPELKYKSHQPKGNILTPQQKGGRAAMNSEKICAAKIQSYLKGSRFPTDKNTLIWIARKNGAPKPVLDILEQLKAEKFDRVVDVQYNLREALA